MPAARLGKERQKARKFPKIKLMTQQDLALTLAIEGVSRKAEVAAEAAGLILGKVLEISEGYGYVAANPKVPFLIWQHPSSLVRWRSLPA